MKPDAEAPLFFLDPSEECVLEPGKPFPAAWKRNDAVIWLLTLSGAAYYVKAGRPVFLSPGTALICEGPLHRFVKIGSDPAGWRCLYLAAANEMTAARLNYVARHLCNLSRIPLDSSCVRHARRLATRSLKEDFWAHSLEACRWFHAWWREAEHHNEEIRKLLGSGTNPKECSQEIFSLKSLADRFGYSPSYLSRLLGRQWKKSPARSLRTARLAFAARQLRETHIQVSSLAGQLGYLSDSAFIRAFRKIYRLSPERYRSAMTRRKKIPASGI